MVKKKPLRWATLYVRIPEDTKRELQALAEAQSLSVTVAARMMINLGLSEARRG